MRSDHLISAKVRSFGQLDCGRDVLHTLWQQGLAVAASGTLARKFRYVDVGASLGDCSLAAAALLPWGALSAVAFDADSRVIGLLREAAQMNGLSGGRANDSSLVARLALLGDEADLRKPADIEVDICVGRLRGGCLELRCCRSGADCVCLRVRADRRGVLPRANEDGLTHMCHITRIGMPNNVLMRDMHRFRVSVRL